MGFRRDKFGPKNDRGFNEAIRWNRTSGRICRLQVRYRRRKPGESFRTHHADIRKLVALALPKLEHKARELMACDYFIDSLNDPNPALKVRERSPKDLDSALKIALQLEVWENDAD